MDRRTDVYSLGAVLFEVLTGAPHPSGMIVSLRSKRPDLPEAVEKVIFKAMAQNPDARYQSVSEFRSAFEYSLRPPARVQAQPTPTPTSYATPSSVPLPPPAKKDTNWAAIILSIMLIAVLCVGAWFLVGVLKGDDVVPEQPTEAPIEPTAPPIEPTVPVNPTETPPPPPLPPICSSVGLAGGVVLLGGMVRLKKRRESED